jgi:hypothetical protein
VAAFRRAADERSKLEALRQRLADLVVLEPEARDALALDGARVAGELAKARDELALLDRARQWYETSTRLRAELAAAAEDAKSAGAAWEASADEREQLANVRRARPLAGPIGAADGASRVRVEATKDLATAEKEEARRVALAVEREQAAQAATERSIAERAFARTKGPELEAARRIDAEVAAAEKRLVACSVRSRSRCRRSPRSSRGWRPPRSQPSRRRSPSCATPSRSRATRARPISVAPRGP